MIDTIILTIPREKIIFFEAAHATKWSLNNKIGVFSKHIKQQSSIQKKDGVYRPRPTIITRGKQIFLKIEFSIPKLLYENNIDEVCENDFPIIIDILEKRLKDFGISISEKNLKKADVTAFHPSKNIILSDGYTASGIIKELSKINLTTRMDLTKDTFRNEGQSLQLYTNSHSLVIYDKIADIKKSKNRAIDKDGTLKQLSLFNPLNEVDELEVLRLEVRLSKKTKMNSILQKIGYEKNPTFADIFKYEVCQKIVELYWKEILLEKHLFLYSLSTSPQDTLKKLMRKFPDMKPKELIFLVGLQQLCIDQNGIRELRKYISQVSHEKTWYRIVKSFEKLNLLEDIIHCHSWVDHVSQTIINFKSIKISHLICKEK